MTSSNNNLSTNLVIASGNAGKVKEFADFLSLFTLNIIQQPKDFYVEETGKTFAENARIKAIAASKFTGEFALADDSGLCVEALGGAPGIHSARYAVNDKARVMRLLQEMESSKNRRAFFAACLCLVSPDQNVLIEVEGTCHGEITFSPRGQNGFGYDPIFAVNGTGQTFAEMELKQKKLFSHRAKALQELLPKFRDIFPT